VVFARPPEKKSPLKFLSFSVGYMALKNLLVYNICRIKPTSIDELAVSVVWLISICPCDIQENELTIIYK
jgi:hypothetical protein